MVLKVVFWLLHETLGVVHLGGARWLSLGENAAAGRAHRALRILTSGRHLFTLLLAFPPRR